MVTAYFSLMLNQISVRPGYAARQFAQGGHLRVLLLYLYPFYQSLILLSNILCFQNGDNWDRTSDLLRVGQALSRLSYASMENC